MISPHQFDAIGKIVPIAPPDPAQSQAGDIMLINGQTMTGYWRFWLNDQIADFVASDGKRWIIPLDSIIAFAPTPEVLNAEFVPQDETHDAGREAQPRVRQAYGYPAISGG